MGIVRPIVDLGTKGDNGGVEGIDGILETELTSGEPHLLSEIIQKRVIAVTKERSGAFFILISDVWLGRSAKDTQMIQVVIGGVKTVTYLTQGYAVGEQT